MTAARWRLYVAFALFAGWVGWLGYQALTHGRFPVLSRAQLLVSQIDIVGVVSADSSGKPAPNVEVQSVHWPPDGGGLKAGERIQVVNLPESTGFVGGGSYIIPLVRDQKPGEFRVAGLPPSPGFVTGGQFFVYPLTPATQRQLETIPKRPVEAR